ncbi:MULTISPECIES: RNA 2',3'-cyclic phosphodiesterase [Arsenicicoccus]|uniref:RNA 2',3'-cyclic phosphodiesterase n=1 Tax=Arsenicicoccus TaxID=267408 RepID=UPI00257C4589|nr:MULTISPECIES: RNA 2',3'-cyclic phosphodiesterase [Arsenicicoccus]
MPRGRRMFLAVTPPEEVLVDLETFLEPRVDADPDLRWARPEQWHLTLAFLPSVSPLSLGRLAERLDELSLQTEPIDLRLTGGGAFPGTADARVLWLGVDDPLEGLDPLARRCRSSANAAGTQVEGGPFRAHLTLARLGMARDVRRWLQVLDTYAGPTWTVDTVSLVESHLGQGPGGRPRYVEHGSFPFA